ncbi:MAG TPA: hypothetical protein VGQ76_09325 [Thermoanaerobaculia bacterium]|jgi:hypothetical protein|nr:hypothetical protein [Thermoanaerobaculia bacterium]
MARRSRQRHAWLDVDGALRGSGRNGFDSNAWWGLPMKRALAGRLFFPPAVAAHLVKLACELPDQAERSLSLWTCA